jgi:Flp pilus assembly protein TadB
MADDASKDASAAASGWYPSLVRGLGGSFESIFPPAKRTAKLQARYELARKSLREAEANVAELEMTELGRSLTLRQAERRAEVAARRLKELDRLLRRTDFRRELYFAGLEVTPDEVHISALAVFVVSFVALLALFLGEIVMFSFIIGPFALMTLGAALLIPLLLYVYLYNYPQWTAARMRIQTLGRAPEAVHYMVMSMRLNPSLDRAVRFAADNVDEPLSSSLRKVLWDVHTRNHPSIEDSFMAFAEEWGHWNEDFKRAMYSIRMATLERTDEGLAKNLEKALEAVLVGTRKRIDDFAAGLQSPTTVLFGLGVLLPMIIGAMLPMIFLAGLGSAISSGVSSTSTNPLQTQPVSAQTTLVANIGFFLLLDVGFPLGALAYASRILSKRPGTLKPPEPPNVHPIFTPIVSFGIAAAIACGIGLIGLPALLYPGLLGGLIFNVWELFPVLGFATGISVYYLLDVWPAYKARKNLERLEAEFPDALFQVGNRMAEGLPLERALDRTAEAMAGTETALMFRRILHGMRVSGQTPEQVIFGGAHGPGLLQFYPSRMVSVSMRALLEAVTKGPEAVGHTIVPMSEYLKALRQVDQSLRTALKPTVSMMMGTAYVFSPLVLGMTGALYVLLSNVLASGNLLITVPFFFLVMGIYLVEMVCVITFFTVGIDQGGDPTGLKVMVGYFLGVSVAIFLIAAAIGLAVIQGVG